MPTFVFSLGLFPVQEWIAQARRSRDLRAGSELLARVMAGILDRLETEFQADVWLPARPAGQSFADLARRSGGGLPNRASGYCEAAEDDVRRVFSALEADQVVAV